LAATIILCLISLRLLRSPLQRVRELTDSGENSLTATRTH